MIAAILLSSAMALTFDDLPGQTVWSVKILATLKKHRAPAIGFVNTRRDDAVSPVLDLWLRDGHQLGNHTAHHVDANAVSVADFEADVIAGEKPLRGFLEKRGKQLNWFRYPMLHTGPNVETRDAIARFLERRGYRNAVVTLDSDEYLYNNTYAAASAERRPAIADAYLRFMDSILTFYEKRTLDVVGRPIPHVLLLHASALNADALDRMLTMFENRGYRFITIGEAMRDPAYRLEDGYAGKAGLSWIHRWGVGKGMPIVWEPKFEVTF